MDDLTKSAFLNRPDLHVGTEGEFQGWRTWSRDTFESHNGPFWHRMDHDGQIHCAFRVEKKHLNGMSNVHGGCFMTFADYCLFAMAAPVLQGPGVTVSFACEFLDAAREGELVEGSGEITRAGGSGRCGQHHEITPPPISLPTASDISRRRIPRISFLGFIVH